MLTNTQSFERRHVLYCDILGFSSYVQGEFFETSRCFRLFHHLDDLINESTREINPLAPEPISGLVPDYVVNPQAIYCSDSIIISTPPTNVDAIWLCEAAARIQNCICHHGFLLRGAITTEFVYHSGNTIFGPAIVKAVELEKTISSPVIVISNETYRVFHDTATPEDEEITSIRSNQLISTENSNSTFVDPFWILKAQCNQTTLHPHANIQISSWRALIEHGLHLKEPGIRKKYLWSAQHFNHSLCNRLSNIKPIFIE